MGNACENCNLKCKNNKLDSSTTTMHYAQLQKVLEDCTKTREERGGFVKLLPTKQNLGRMKIDTPAKSSHRTPFEQFIATEDIMLLSPVPYILIRIVVTSQKIKILLF